MNLTAKEFDLLIASRSEDDWNRACDAVKAARNGAYPPDWWDRMMLSGVMRAVASRWVER